MLDASRHWDRKREGEINQAMEGRCWSDTIGCRVTDIWPKAWINGDKYDVIHPITYP